MHLPTWDEKKRVKKFSKQVTQKFESKFQSRKIINPPHPLPLPPSTSSEASLRCLLGLTPQQHVDLLFDPVFVVWLVRLCVGTIPEAAREIIFSIGAFSFSPLEHSGCSHALKNMQLFILKRQTLANKSPKETFPLVDLPFFRVRTTTVADRGWGLLKGTQAEWLLE